MQAMLLHSSNLAMRRRDEGGSGLGCFIALMVIGAVIYFVMKGRRDKAELLGASKRPMGSGPIAPQTFANPFPKCPNCAAAGDKMKQQWDGLRKVTWTCGYCGNQQVQELKDEELPLSARERLGLGGNANRAMGDGYPMQQGGGGMGMGGGLLTGMMIGSMMGGNHHDHHQDGGWSGGGDSGSTGGNWGEGGGDSGGDSSGDWGDSGGDFGGGDSGGSDW